MHLGKASALLSLTLALVFTVGGMAQAQGAKTGKPRGLATFYGIGKVQEYAPDVMVWTGTFPGQSVTDSGQGALHFSAWECTGEVVYRGGKVAFGGGFCAVTDKDGDKVNLRWQVDEQDANPVKFKTKGTYLSGSGKYAGIQGGYNFICESIGTTSHFVCPIVGGEYQLP